VNLPVNPAWAGKTLDVVVATGPLLDELTGFPARMQASQIRSFDDYLTALEDNRCTDGLYVAVVEKASVFLDQSRPTVEFPASFARIARQADDQRFQGQEALETLWERHVLGGRIIPANIHRALAVTD